MCLNLHTDIAGKTLLKKSRSTSGIRRTKDGKFLIGYKSLAVSTQNERPRRGDFFILRSRILNYAWGSVRVLKTTSKKSKKFPEYELLSLVLSLAPESKTLQKSSRENVELTDNEINTNSVNEGFHFWTSKKAALKRTSVIVECHIPIESFVAQGIFTTRSFVSTTAKIHKIIKMPTRTVRSS